MAVSSTFLLDFVAPERVLIAGEATMVTVPGIHGDIGILSGHAPLVSQLRPGVVRVRQDDQTNGAEEKFFITGGVVEMGEQHCIILAEVGQPVSEINLADAKSAFDEAKLAFEHAPDAVKKNEVMSALNIAQARLTAAEAVSASQYAQRESHSS